jgi:hypothetical protein
LNSVAGPHARVLAVRGGGSWGGRCGHVGGVLVQQGASWVHVGPTLIGSRWIWSDPEWKGEMQMYLFILKDIVVTCLLTFILKKYYSNMLDNVSRPVTTVLHSSYRSIPPVLVQCDHNSDRIIATGHLPVTIAHS